jgi:hypothetical protein
VPPGGGTPAPVAHLNDHVFMSIALDEAHVYVNVRNLPQRRDSVLAIPRSGGAATELLRGITAVAMIPDGAWLYLLTPGTSERGESRGDGAVLRVKTDGSGWEKIATGLRMPLGCCSSVTSSISPKEAATRPTRAAE